MEAIILLKEQFQELLNSVDEIKSALINQKNESEYPLLPNHEFIKLMNISKRTAQAWRDNGKISFSQVGGKIYYSWKDVQSFLDDNYKQSFKPKK